MTLRGAEPRRKFAWTKFLRGRIEVLQPVKGPRFTIDSVLLAGFCRVREGESVMDLGCGTGIIPALLKEYYHPGKLFGVELQEELFSCARETLARNCGGGGEVVRADLRDDFLPGEKFDLVVSNPPFYETHAGRPSMEESRRLSRQRENCSLQELFKAASRFMKEKGRFCFILPFSERERAAKGLEGEGMCLSLLRNVHDAVEEPPKRTLFACVRESRKPVELPPLFMKGPGGEYSPELRKLLGEDPLRDEPSFFCDAMLFRLAKYMRFSGHDCAYLRGADDGWLLEECLRSGRVLVTKDRDLAARCVRRGAAFFEPSSFEPRTQFREVTDRFPPDPGRPKRCLKCNAPALRIEKDKARGLVPEYTYATQRDFFICPCCSKLTWGGTHLARFNREVLGKHTSEGKMNERESLKKLLKQNSLKIGDFVLASGKRSNYYFDSKLTTLTAEGAYLVGKCFFEKIREGGIEADLIGGMTLGSDPIVTSVALVSRLEGKPIDAFIVRKEAKGHGTQNWLEGLVEKGKRTIIVDDVVTTGGSTFKAIEKAEEFGLEVVAVIALLDREEGGGEALSARYPFFPVIKKSEIME